jgi:3-oxoacyl-[acyl-carrier-protein] synthase-3
MSSIRAVIEGVGAAVPEKRLTNADLERMVDTNNEWIMQRVGISERRITESHETTSTLSIQAAKIALENAGVRPDELDLIICATVTGDMFTPSTACLIQNELGAFSASAFDLNAACAGFIYALNVACSMIQSGQHQRVLVIGADTLTKFVDWSDRSTCILFGDAAGAVVLTGRTDTDRGVLESVLLADGRGAKHINIEVGGSRNPLSDPCSLEKRSSITMAGSEVYRFAVKAIGDACCQVLEKAGMTSDQIDLFVPHQANDRIIVSATERLNLPREKVFRNIQKYGNTSAGSVPLALYEAEQSGQLKKGMLVLTVGCGAGLVWGANLIRW